MATASPLSSPRLPSPPPIAEDQSVGPPSPVPTPSENQGRLGGFVDLDQAASRRIRPGTKAADMLEGPPLIELADIDSAFQLTEHLKALHMHHTNHIASDTTVPISRASAVLLSTPPSGIDRALWLYELCRFLVQKVNIVIVGLFSDSPSCSAQTCSEMRASEWQYLCAVHDPPKSCCAIDYCCHTLDWAASTLTSPKHFPSRLTLSGGEGGSQQGQQMQIRHLTNIFRRVYRIFAHAWFQHREMFWRVEGKTGLYVFFKTVCDMYNLIPEDNYTVPPEAEGIEAKEASPDNTKLPPGVLLRRGAGLEGREELDISSTLGSPSAIHIGATARRQRHGHSRASSVVTTVVEEIEDDDEDDDDSSQITEVNVLPSEPPIREGKYDGTTVHESESGTSEVEAFPDIGDEGEGGDEPVIAPSDESSERSSQVEEIEIFKENDAEPFPDVDPPAADSNAATTSVGD